MGNTSNLSVQFWAWSTLFPEFGSAAYNSGNLAESEAYPDKGFRNPSIKLSPETRAMRQELQRKTYGPTRLRSSPKTVVNHLVNH